MRLLFAMTLAISLCCAVCHGQEIVKNPDFSIPQAADASRPADWRLPAGDLWRRAETGGPEDGPCLAYESGAAVSGPVSQKCDFLTPGAEHELSALVKNSGAACATLRAVDASGGTDNELGLTAGLRKAGWYRVSTRFRPQTAEVMIQIFADPAHVKGESSVGGQVRVAEVRVAPVAAPAADTWEAPGENIALGKPYTMTPAGYAYSHDEGDATQLTDGEYTVGHFWTRKTTVGWSGGSSKFVLIDLGEDMPIKGVSYNTAAGVAEVEWPASILIFTGPSPDELHGVGDLLALSTARNPLPGYGNYAVQRIWTDELKTHGRYVYLHIEPDTNYAFCDEIEVYLGDEAWVDAPYESAAIADLPRYMEQRRTNRLVQAQFLRDLAAAELDIRGLADKGDLPALADELDRRIRTMPIIDMDGFRAVLPMTDLERDIFRLQAQVWRAQGKDVLRVWQTHRWDPLAPSAEPGEAEQSPVVTVHMMNNEHRADVVNLTNASDEQRQFKLKITGLPGGENPDYVRVHEVLTVGTRHFVAVSAALPDAPVEEGEYVITVPSGMTRQVWFSFNPTDLPAGTHSGAVEISGEDTDTRVPISLRIYPIRFPDETTLLVGGWTYTDAEAMYGITVQNKDAVLDHLQEHYVNAPWASSSSLGNGKYDADGNMTQEPDTTRFDNWVDMWPNAKMYMVFKALSPTSASFEGSALGSDMFNIKVGNWARFWADHMRELELEPNQLGILILDEPHGQEQYDVITAWAKAIEAAAPGLVTWEDPQPTDDETPLEMFASVDVLCPYRNPFLARPQWYRDMYRKQQEQGRELWFYNADGPARSFDPFSFYLVQEWHCFQVGAKGSNFWAFGDNGGVSCWNEYPAPGAGPYCPTYIDETSITAAKYMEAIREGIEDYEYLTMLKSRVEELEAAGADAAKLAKAKDLLVSGPERVMAMERGANYRWDEEKDRAVADRVRVQVLEALTELAEL